MTAPDAGTPWLRLDARMLLVHPLQEVGRFLPILLGLLVAGGASGAGPWTLLGVVAPVVLGVVRYLTTRWRISDGRVELRRGLLQRHHLSTPLDRVRSVDLTASPIHRVLGLATVVIGTGNVATETGERLELDALPRPQASALRVDLLGARLTAGATGDEPGRAPWPPPPPPHVVAAFSPAWLRYAPFSTTGLVAAAATVGAVAQYAEGVRVELPRQAPAAVGGGVLVALVLVALLAAVALNVGGYLVSNGGYRLTRAGAAWHVERGLLTRRETSIDVERLAGVSLGEPAALRLLRGRRLTAIVTGRAGSGGASLLVPPAPEATVARAATTVLGSGAAVAAELRDHGPRAGRRRYVRALLGAVPLVAAALLALAAGASPLVLAAVPVVLAGALALARGRATALGHAVVDGHVVMRSGSLTRSRDMLATDHVIGWSFRATWFQRRIGLVTVAATTGGGHGRIQVYDVPAGAAYALGEAATPGLLAQFSTGSPAER